MKALDAKKRAIERQCAQMGARRQRIRHGLVEVRTVARHVASKPSTLAAAGLCGALAGYLVSERAQTGSRAKEHQRGDRGSLIGSALRAVARVATLIPTGLAVLSTLSADASPDRAAQKAALQASDSGSGDAW